MKKAQGDCETVLFAVLGMSPSVLTETVWALARAPTPVLPDRVVVLTTTAGREALERQLFMPEEARLCGWERLVKAIGKRGLSVEGRLKFGVASDHVRLFPAPSGKSDLADIATTADNDAAADFILREVRAFTENPATAVLASIAGGRKTMGALLMSCMSLLGRTRDRVLHVLVNAPFDGPLDPPFLFPEKGVAHRLRDGSSVRSADAKVELIDVPFARMRGWYEGAFKAAPPGYAALVAGVQSKAPAPQNYPHLTLDRAHGCLLADDRDDVKLSATEFGALTLLLSGVGVSDEIARILNVFRVGNTPLPPKAPQWLHDLKESSRFSGEDSADDLRKTLSSARKKLARLPALAPLVETLVPLRGRVPSYPSGKIRFVGDDPFADIRG